MASNGSSINICQPAIPIFKGECYEFWSIKMKTLFKSQDLWDLVENGYSDPDEETRLKENQKKDNKALFFIQQAVHETIFSRISAATTSKQAWRTLQHEFQGSTKVMVVKLQTLRHQFETLFMKSNESVQDFLSRVTTIVSQMRAYGEQITDETIVTKVLRSLPSKFDHVVAAIEESKDLSIFSFDELMGSLQSHEVRINRSFEKHEEKAFQVSNFREFEMTPGRGRGRGGFRGRSRGRGRGKSEQRQQHRNSVQCYHCGKYGHMQAACWYKNEQMNFAEEDEETEEEESKLFMALNNTDDIPNDVWFVDSGCSNHMTGMRSMFKELDESYKIKVRLGDNKQVQVEGKGTVAIKINALLLCIPLSHQSSFVLLYTPNNGKVEFIYSVHFVPGLAFNLLSVGQLMGSGFSVLFDDGLCVIKEKRSGQIMVNVRMTGNNMFPLEVLDMGDYALVADQKSESKLWHLRYGHFNMKGLKLLNHKDMVHGLPKIDSLDLCEGCVYGKQTRRSFPVGTSWRASKCLELTYRRIIPKHERSSLLF